MPFLVADPANGFDVLSSSADEIVDHGWQAVREVSTTRYQLHISGSSMLEAVGMNPDTAGALAGQADVSVWVDREGLVRRLQLTFEVRDGGTSKTHMLTEYWDFGTAPSVQLPSPDDVFSVESEGSIWAAALEPSLPGTGEPDDPGCYGANFESCLQTSIPAASPRVTAPDCAGTGRRVCLVSMGAVRPDLIDNVVAQIRDRGVHVEVLPGLSIEPQFADETYSQADSFDLLTQAMETYPELSAFGVTTLLLTPIDIRGRDSAPGSFLFGERFGEGNERYYGVISTFRFDPETFGEPANDELFFKRTRKMVLKYVGNMYFGYPETESTDSVMRLYINSLSLLDSLPERLPEGAPPCWRDGPRICLVPVGPVRLDILERVAADAEAVYGIPIDVMEGTEFDERYRDLIRGQFSAERAYLTVWAAYNGLSRLEPKPIMIGVTEEPIYSALLFDGERRQPAPEGLAGSFTLAEANPIEEWPAGIISTHTLGESPPPGLTELEAFESRLAKLLAIEIGLPYYRMPIGPEGTLLHLPITTAQALDDLPQRIP